MIRLVVLAVMLALLLGACDVDRQVALTICINRSIDPDHLTSPESYPDRIRACGEAVKNAFGDK